MKIITIANNIKGNFDGIGKHARLLAEEFRRQGHSVNLISGSSGWKKYLSIMAVAMSFAYIRAIYTLLIKHFDVVIIEYPFREHNPIVVLFHIVLYYVTRGVKTKVAFSMHEYDRVSVLRKRIIDVFLRYSDIVFVSEEKYFERFAKYREKIYLRTIPNHIVCNKINKKYNRNEFCYFGLISRSKAFTEMLKAWEVFNNKNVFSLHIISSSELPKDILLPQGVTFYHDLPTNEVVNIMFDCAYSIVPVIPEIGLNNSSFVSSVQCGCVPIGIFSKELSTKDFVIHCDSYNLDDFVRALNKTKNISIENFNKMSCHSIDYGKNFSLEKTAMQMIAACEQ